MAELAIDIAFLQRYAKLQPPVRRAVDHALAKFSAHTHAGLHLEKLTGARDPNIRTIAVTSFYRGVVLALGAARYVLLDVLPHDDADAYAVSRVFSVNQALGVLQTRDQAGIEELDRTLPATPPAAGLFDKVSTADLLRMGIDRDLIPLLRRISTDRELDGLTRLLSRTQADVLNGLGAGIPVEEVWQELAADILTGVARTGLPLWTARWSWLPSWPGRSTPGESSCIPLSTSWHTGSPTTDRCWSPEAQEPARPSLACTVPPTWPVGSPTTVPGYF
jgi:hypothetical protein